MHMNKSKPHKERFTSFAKWFQRWLLCQYIIQKKIKSA